MKMSCLLLSCLDLFMQRERDAATINSQRGVIESALKLVDRMPAQLSQSIAAQLQASVIPSLGNRTGQVLNLRTGAAQGSAAAQSGSDDTQSQATMAYAAALPEPSQARSAATQPSSAHSAADSPCDIPNPPIAKGVPSLEGVWQQYTSGTATAPSILQLYAHHGHDWQRAQHGYNKADFGKKRKLICAIEGVQQLQLASPRTAVSIMKSKVAASGSPLVRFMEKLPNLTPEIHPDGKQQIVAGPITQALRSEQKKVYQEYLQELKDKLRFCSDPLV